MSYQATVYKVMIASPSDVKEERQIVREEIANWNAAHSEARGTVLLPVSWEANAAPSSGDRPQGIINKRILAGADLLVGVFWTRLGTSTGKFPSGTVEEIEEHIAQDRPAMLYFSQVPITAENLDVDQFAGVRKLRDSLKDRALYHTYDDARAFRSDFAHHLQITMNSPQFAPANAALGLVVQRSAPALGEKARELLLGAVASKQGTIMYRSTIGNTIISIGSGNLVEGTDARQLAAWKGALEDLENAGLVGANPTRSVFTVTHAGFELAESLKDE